MGLCNCQGVSMKPQWHASLLASLSSTCLSHRLLHLKRPAEGFWLVSKQRVKWQMSHPHWLHFHCPWLSSWYGHRWRISIRTCHWSLSMLGRSTWVRLCPEELGIVYCMISIWPIVPTVTWLNDELLALVLVVLIIINVTHYLPNEC